jgi:hypothetical protein
MTPGEIFKMMEGYRRECENQEKLSLFYAWQTGRVAASFFGENPITLEELLREYDGARREDE